MASQLHNLAVKLADLLLNGLARLEQRSDRSHQLRTARDQLLGSHGEDIELGAADDETEVLKKAANMVLEVALDLDQQRPAGQQPPAIADAGEIQLAPTRRPPSALTEWLSISLTSKACRNSAGTSSQPPAPGQQPGLQECPAKPRSLCRSRRSTGQRQAPRRPQVPLSRTCRRAKQPRCAQVDTAGWRSAC